MLGCIWEFDGGDSIVKEGGIRRGTHKPSTLFLVMTNIKSTKDEFVLPCGST